jgi:N-acetyl-anhydromuramyl-L-alanine amidase AmpD
MRDSRAFLGLGLGVLLAAGVSSPAAAAQVRSSDAEIARRDLRAQAPSLFESAADEFGVPADLLRAYAFVDTHWANTQLERHSRDEDHMPVIYGIMGLHDGRDGWFINQIGRAARLLGVSEDEIKNDPATNVRAAAALLAEEGRKSRVEGKGLESWARAIERMSAIPVREPLDRFARKSESYEVLMTLVRGYDRHGIAIPRRALKMERAFTSDDLQLLRAPQVSPESIESWDKTAAPDGVEGMQTSVGPPDYPSALWNPTTCYSSRNGSATTHVAIHMMQGYYASTISWFKNCANNVSAHYLMRSSDGQITQMVREADMAWHVKASNPYTVGIEHEGFMADVSWFTEAMYNNSAALTRSICDRLGIDETKTYFGTAQTALPDASYSVKGHVHFPAQTHTDPGTNWSWARYRSEVAFGLGVAYQAHVQNIGWQAAVCDGAVAGTTRQNLRVEAMRVWLTGAAAGTHVCYRAQVEALGWLGEVCDDANMGTAGQNLRLEAFQIEIWK